MQDFQAKVAKFGVNSPEVMQLISLVNAEVFVPYDIMQLAKILFQPILWRMSSSKNGTYEQSSLSERISL